MATTVYTAIIEKEGDLYAALCPELDVASQGATVEKATSNLREAIELFLECADAEEIKRRLWTDVFVTRIEAKHGSTSRPVRTRSLSILQQPGSSRCTRRRSHIVMQRRTDAGSFGDQLGKGFCRQVGAHVGPEDHIARALKSLTTCFIFGPKLASSGSSRSVGSPSIARTLF
jgi:predicted RNase H-like HicB family nuclease